MAGIVNGINMAGKMEPEFAKMPFVIPIACFIGIAYSIYCYKCVQQVRVKPFKQLSIFYYYLLFKTRFVACNILLIKQKFK